MSDGTFEPDLSGRRVLIPGGTGGVGEGAVRAYLAAGADVVVPTRGQERADAFVACSATPPAAGCIWSSTTTRRSRARRNSPRRWRTAWAALMTS